MSETVPEYIGDISWHDSAMRMMWGIALGGGSYVFHNDTSCGCDPQAAIASQAVNRDLILNLEGHAARFFNTSGIHLDNMTPDATKCSTGVCLVDPNKEYVVYSHTDSTLTVDLSGTASKFVGRFYDPRAGQCLPSCEIAGGSPTTLINKPTATDGVLHLAVGSTPTITPTPTLKGRRSDNRRLRQPDKPFMAPMTPL